MICNGSNSSLVFEMNFACTFDLDWNFISPIFSAEKITLVDKKYDANTIRAKKWEFAYEWLQMMYDEVSGTLLSYHQK